MSSWPEVRAALLESFRAVEADETFLALELRSDARAQTVMVTYVEGEQTGDWIKVESGFAPVSPRALAVAIDHVGREENSGVGVGRVTDFLLVRWTAFVDTASASQVLQMVDGVAGHADRLEALLSNEDEF